MALKEGKVGIGRAAGWLLQQGVAGTGALMETTVCDVEVAEQTGSWLEGALKGEAPGPETAARLAPPTEFWQLPNLKGKQLTHCWPAFTQAQPRHRPVLLHLQHTIVPCHQLIGRRVHCLAHSSVLPFGDQGEARQARQ